MVLRKKSFTSHLAWVAVLSVKTFSSCVPETFDYCWVGDLNSCTCTVQIVLSFVLPGKSEHQERLDAALKVCITLKVEKSSNKFSCCNYSITTSVEKFVWSNLFVCVFFFLFGAFYLHLLWTPTFSTAHAYFYTGSVCVSQKCCNILWYQHSQLLLPVSLCCTVTNNFVST